MKIATGKITTVFIMLLLLSFFSSCSVERKIAKEYIVQRSQLNLLIIPPDFLYKVSLKEWQIDSAGELTEWEIDSALFENSLFLREVSDSVFLDYYAGNYIAEMAAYGINVYPQDSLTTFLDGKNNAYIINMAQLELEEYIMPVKQEEVFGESVYYHILDLNAVNLNSWFEISKVNGDDEAGVYFSSMHATDGMEGYFRFNYFNDDVKFVYEIDSLGLDIIYKLAALAGHTYAAYTFDFLLNKYIDKRMDEEGLNRSNVFYHFNRYNNYLHPAKNEEWFIPLE